jgi:hypothetical protein
MPFGRQGVARPGIHESDRASYPTRNRLALDKDGCDIIRGRGITVVPRPLLVMARFTHTRYAYEEGTIGSVSG